MHNILHNESNNSPDFNVILNETYTTNLEYIDNAKKRLKNMYNLKLWHFKNIVDILNGSFMLNVYVYKNNGTSFGIENNIVAVAYDDQNFILYDISSGSNRNAQKKLFKNIF